ncbi:N-acetylglucosamine kinase [Pseudorhizobium marinum]|uniref:N-acetylglucosamine kinase n=1 Tax=Pseudorhizobium marinum TaxID=1496690 RepID=UPI00049614D9|nr:BadF/BadG/BcrA/BcrD ATPase family protein [Pseudorhizobium marinum]
MADWIGATDGGGSKTASALLSSSGELVPLPIAGGCNPQDNRAWKIELEQVMVHLRSGAPSVKAVTMGMPGFGEVRELDRAVSAVVTAGMGATAFICNDVEMAFHGAFPQGEGLLLLVGTGSMAIAGTQAGGSTRITRVGGWGDSFGDEGSGYWIGRQALSLATRELDGRLPATGFAEKLCQALHLSLDRNPLALMEWTAHQDHTRSAIASLAQTINGLAEDGDMRAREVLQDAAHYLAEHHAAGMSKGGLSSGTPWATAGSVFDSAIILGAVSTLIGQPPVGAALPPIGGGLLLAARQAGWAVDTAFIDNLARQLELAPPSHKRT